MKTPKTVRLLVCGIGGRSDRLLCTPGLDVPGSFVSELETPNLAAQNQTLYQHLGIKILGTET